MRKPLRLMRGNWLLPLTLGIAISSVPARAQVYPSAGAFWVGGACFTDLQHHECDPTDQQTRDDGLRTSLDVVRWEATHADFSAWGGFQYRTYVPSMTVLDYMYVGALNADGLFVWETDLRKHATLNGHKFEDFFLHYSEDTTLWMTDFYQKDAVWAGVPSVIGYTLSGADHDGVVLPGTGPWSSDKGDIFKGEDQGSAFYLAIPEKFAEATFTLQQAGIGGTILIEYASAYDPDTFTITGWQPLSVDDQTHNFGQSGRISWIPPVPPVDWVWGYNPKFKDQDLVTPRRRYAHWLRITPRVRYTVRPILSNLTTRAWLVPDYPAGSFTNLGWDPANDRNGDGYVDDNEYADPNRNTSANARFRYESRLAMNNGWFGPDWSLAAANTANPTYQQDVADYYRGHWLSPLVNGAYNDNFWLTLNPWLYPVATGGDIIPEGDIHGTVPSEDTDRAYGTAFDAVLKRVKDVTHSPWMGANISNVNPYDFHGWDFPYPFLTWDMLQPGLFDWFILESTFYDDWPMVDVEPGYSPGPGLSRLWHIPAFAKAGIKSAIMTRVGPDLLPSPPFDPNDPNTKAKWERSQSALLSEYYLFNFPGWTFFQSIYYNIIDISQLTTTDNYYKPGVPSNYAYQPHKMMAVDIGTPARLIPPGYPAMQYTAAVDGTPEKNNTIVGVSTDDTLFNPSYDPPYGEIPVLPTYTYYLLARYCAPDCPPYTRIVYDPQHNPFPAEVVLARHYTKGLVIFRTSFSYPALDENNNPNYKAYASDANEISVTLPCTYQRVDFGGRLAPPSNQITLHGYEGAVLFNPAPVIITSPVVAGGATGKFFSYQITATNGPTSFDASGLPGGLRIDFGSGRISGIPSASGTFNVRLSAANPSGTGTATLQVTIRQIGPGPIGPPVGR